MQKLKRNINIGFRVTAEEQERIRRAQARTGINSLRAYLLKMAVDGMVVIELDLAEMRERNRLLRNIRGNINQIVKRLNETGIIYATDIADIQLKVGEIWQQQDKIIRTLTKIVETA